MDNFIRGSDEVCRLSIAEVNPISQTDFGGKSICGVRGGKSFSEVLRPNLQNECPSGTSACSQNTNSGNTVCYPQEEHDDACPITEIKFVQNSELDSIQDSFTQVTFNSEKTLLYSKNNLDALPISSFAVTKAPCLDPSRSADYISNDELDDNGNWLGRDTLGEFYPLEKDRFDYLREEKAIVL